MSSGQESLYISGIIQCHEYTSDSEIQQEGSYSEEACGGDSLIHKIHIQKLDQKLGLEW